MGIIEMEAMAMIRFSVLAKGAILCLVGGVGANV